MPQLPSSPLSAATTIAAAAAIYTLAVRRHCRRRHRHSHHTATITALVTAATTATAIATDHPRHPMPVVRQKSWHDADGQPGRPPLVKVQKGCTIALCALSRWYGVCFGTFRNDS